MRSPDGACARSVVDRLVVSCARTRPTARSAASRRSVPPRIGHDAPRWTRPSLRSAVELRLRETRRGLAQGLVGPLQLPVLSLELLQAPSLTAGQPRGLAQVTPGLVPSLARPLGGPAELRRDRTDWRPLRVVLALTLQHQSNRPLPCFRRIPCLRLQDSILPSIGVSGSPGAAHVLMAFSASRVKSRGDPHRVISGSGVCGPGMHGRSQERPHKAGRKVAENRTIRRNT